MASPKSKLPLDSATSANDDSDEELASLRLAALLSRKSHPAVPQPLKVVNSDLGNSLSSVIKTQAFVKRKNWMPNKRRNGPHTQNSTARSNLIVINPVAIDENEKKKPSTTYSLALPQNKWCSPVKTESVSSSVKRKGPSRFSRYDSSSDSGSDSDFDFKNESCKDGDNKPFIIIRKADTNSTPLKSSSPDDRCEHNSSKLISVSDDSYMSLSCDEKLSVSSKSPCNDKSPSPLNLSAEESLSIKPSVDISHILNPCDVDSAGETSLTSKSQNRASSEISISPSESVSLLNDSFLGALNEKLSDSSPEQSSITYLSPKSSFSENSCRSSPSSADSYSFNGKHSRSVESVNDQTSKTPEELEAPESHDSNLTKKMQSSTLSKNDLRFALNNRVTGKQKENCVSNSEETKDSYQDSLFLTLSCREQESDNDGYSSRSSSVSSQISTSSGRKSPFKVVSSVVKPVKSDISRERADGTQQSSEYVSHSRKRKGESTGHSPSKMSLLSERKSKDDSSSAGRVQNKLPVHMRLGAPTQNLYIEMSPRLSPWDGSGKKQSKDTRHVHTSRKSSSPVTDTSVRKFVSRKHGKKSKKYHSHRDVMSRKSKSRR